MTTCYLFGVKDGQPVVVSKIYHIIVGMHTYAVDIFLSGQTIAAHMTDKLFLVLVKLPDTHRRCTPDITVIGLHDFSHHPISQRITILETHSLLIAWVILEQTLIRSNEYVAIPSLAERVAHHTIQNTIPSVRTETICLRVITRHTCRCGHPYVSFTIEHHGHNPVVVQPSLYRVMLRR